MALIPYRETGPWSASCTWFGAQTGLQRPPRSEFVHLDSSVPETLGHSKDDWCLPDGNARPALNYLIIMVPDPITTHLALYFDRTIETLEAAAQQQKLFLDGYWLPWPIPGSATPPGDTAADLRVSAILNVYRSGQPGLMIFSGPDKSHCEQAGPGDSCVTYAFLVSESPTSGINKTQFKNAVAYARALSGSDPPSVHAVGPFFSGSAPSAIALNHDVEKEGVRLDFVSGTMSSLEQATAMREEWVTFDQTLHDDAHALAALLDFLHERHLTQSGRNVAILEEDETRYGSPQAATTTSPYPHVHHLKFPRELSRLRNAAGEHFGAAPTPAAQAEIAPNDQLAWNWKDSSNAEDGVPAFSGAQSPLSQQAVLLSISDVIRQENIRYVGISATDIFDILFLSKFLKIAAPNTRVFVLDADLLMVKASSEGRELDGTLAVTTYPLFARDVDWTQPSADQRSVVTFPSRIAQGVYNAVVFQLDRGHHDPMREYSDPLWDASGTTPNDRPPLWLTMVGRNGFWPVGRQQNDPIAKQDAPSPGTAVVLDAKVSRRLTFDPPDGTSLLLQSTVLIWGLIHLSGMLLGRKADYAWFRQFHVTNTAARPENAWRRNYYLFCGSLTLSAMLELTAISYLSLISDGHLAFIHPPFFPYLFPFFYCMTGIVGLMLTGAAVSIAIKPIMRSVNPLYLLPASLLYGLTIGLWLSLSSGHNGSGMFFALRALSLSNTISPLMPVELLLLMYYLWAWAFIRKVRLADSKQVTLPDLDHLGPAGAGLQGYWTDLRTASDDIVFNRRVATAVVAGYCLTIIFVLRPWETLLSVEGPFYDGVVNLLVFFICLIIVMVLGRYLYVWNCLKRILRGLERTPLRRAFGRFPDTYAWSPLWYEDAERRAYVISARSVECFQALVACRRPSDPLQSRCDVMNVAFKRVVSLDTDDADEEERNAAVYELQTLFAEASEYLLDHGLVERWLKQGGSDTLDEAAKSKDRAAVKDGIRERDLLEEEFVALRFVALIHYESAQLKNLIGLLGVGFVLAVVAVGSYPFLAARQCVWSFAAAFLLFGFAIVVSFAQMDRDAIMSRLGGTVAGKLDWSFLLRAVSYGGLPLLTLLASQFPSFGRALLAWLEPALNALH